MSKTCLNCGRTIQETRHTKRYCTDTCKQKAYYKRTEDKKTNAHHATATAPTGTETLHSELQEFDRQFVALLEKWKVICDKLKPTTPETKPCIHLPQFSVSRFNPEQANNKTNEL